MATYVQLPGRKSICPDRRLQILFLPGNCTYVECTTSTSIGDPVWDTPSKQASVITMATEPRHVTIGHQCDTRPSRTALYWKMKIMFGLFLHGVTAKAYKYSRIGSHRSFVIHIFFCEGIYGHHCITIPGANFRNATAM